MRCTDDSDANKAQRRWCSDGFEIGCDDGERVRIAFTLECCDCEAISWVATTGGINSGGICDLMLESIERRFGLVTRLPMPIGQRLALHRARDPRFRRQNRPGAANNTNREPRSRRGKERRRLRADRGRAAQ
jgi:hypothetical protein